MRASILFWTGTGQQQLCIAGQPAYHICSQAGEGTASAGEYNSEFSIALLLSHLLIRLAPGSSSFKHPALPVPNA